MYRKHGKFQPCPSGFDSYSVCVVALQKSVNLHGPLDTGRASVLQCGDRAKMPHFFHSDVVQRQDARLLTWLSRFESLRRSAALAQWTNAPGYEPGDWGFESLTQYGNRR